MKRNHIVRYPGSIGQIFETFDEITTYKGKKIDGLHNLLEKSGLPEKTRFRWSDMDGKGTLFGILLPTGEIFGGVALLHPDEKDDPIRGLMVAAGRAVAVWQAYNSRGEEKSWLLAYKGGEWINTIPPQRQ